MKKILGIAALLLVASPAFAASTIEFDVRLGGDPHCDDWANGTITPYTLGSDAGGTVNAGESVNWSVHVTASGTTGDFPIFGAANIVFDLELWQNGSLVAVGAGGPGTAGFWSCINDGDQDAGQAQADPLKLAAFAWGLGDGATKGRLFDLPTDPLPGPGMIQHTYPSAAGFPAGSTAELGKLVGMGAGYTKYMATAGSERGGVGIEGAFADFCTGLGKGPIAEGQINTTGLNGEYTLRVVPSLTGNNVLKNTNDFACDFDNPGNFAVKADAVVADEITFTVIGTGCNVAPAMTGAVSRRTHGAAGNFDIPLPTVGNVAVEGRQGGPQTLVVTYDKPIGGTANVALSSGALGTVSMAGSELTINLSGVTDGACLTVTINGVACADNAGQVAAAHSFKVRSIFGDVNGSGAVNAGDIGLVKQQSLQPITAANFKMDVNASGAVNAGDIGLVKSRSLVITADPCTN